MNKRSTTPTKQKAEKSAQQTKSTPATALPAVPGGEWPGAFGAYKYSRDAVRFNLGPYILLAFVFPFLASIVISMIDMPSILNSLINNAVSAYFAVASTLVILAAIRRKRIELGDALKQSEPIVAVKTFFLTLLLGLIVVGSALLFIIPLFIVGPRIILALYYLIDKNLSIGESITASWNITKGHYGKIYGIIGATILMALLMVTIIGIPFSIYFLVMYSAVTPLLYIYLEKKAPTTPSEQ